MPIISVLYGNICTISNIVKKIKKPGNMLLFMLICWKARQIKKCYSVFETGDRGGRHYQYQSLMLKAARAEGFFCIHRLFIVDQFRFTTLISKLRNRIRIVLNPARLYAQSAGLGDRENPPTLIAGGLVCDEEDARNAINAGSWRFPPRIPGSGR